MRFYSVLITLCLLSVLSHAQDLVKNSVNMDNGGLSATASATGPAPREWIKEEDQVSGRIPRAKLSKMQSITGDVISFLENAFVESDINPAWHGEYSSVRFGVDCRLEDRKSHLSIMSNDISPLLRYLTVNGKEVAGIRPAGGSKDGCPWYQYEDDNHLRTIIWLVPNGRDQLPFIAITRKEYLEEARAELTAIKERIIESIKGKTPVRAAAVQEAEKKAAIDDINLRYSGTDRQVRMRMFLSDYMSDEVYQQNSIDKATAGLSRTLWVIDSLRLRSTPAELGKPAMVSVEAVDFIGFDDQAPGYDQAADMNMLVRVNPSYYNSALGFEKPQLFLVSWTYDPGNAAAVAVDRQIREDMDLRPLQDMLGK